MIRRLIAVTLAFTLAEIAGFAQTPVDVSIFGGNDIGARTVTDSAGNPIPYGNDVEIGYFTSGFNVGANAQPTQQSLQNLWANWHQFGATTIGPVGPGGAFTGAGQFQGEWQKTDPSFNGQTIYMWIFHTSGNVAPNTIDFGNVTEYGLFSSSKTSSSQNTWIFPSTTATFTQPDAITTADIDRVFVGTLIGDATSGSVQLAAVPEPSGLAIFGLGLFLAGWVTHRVRS